MAPVGRPLRIAAPDDLERMARGLAADLREALGVEEKSRARRRLAEKVLPREWDVLRWEQVTQTADSPPHKLHCAFVGATGEYRAGSVVPEFEALYAQLVRQTSGCWRQIMV